MIGENEFDRLLASWLETEGPQDVPARLVDDALASARRQGQLGGWLDGLLGRYWPADTTGPWSPGWRRLMTIALVAVLTLALVGIGVLGGSAILDRIRAVPAPTGLPAPSALPAPTATPAPPADEPCAAMTHLRFPDVPRANSRDPIPAVGPFTGNGDVLVRINTDASGGTGIERLDPSQSPPSPVESSAGGELALQSAPVSSSVARGARMVVSPDGRAVAFEAGDLGSVGCGDPIVVSAKDGYRRPFPGRAYELISDLAWAPDGSSLYGIRRPTRDASGVAYTDALGPGTVLRWDTATGKMTELPAGCEDCSQLFVSPNGTHIAAEGAGVVRFYDADGGWRQLTSGEGLLGWADDQSIVLRSGRVDLDGGSVVRWDSPETARHFSTGPLLSRDGTTIAAMTLSSDLKHENVTLIDVRDGSTRIIGSLLIGVDCELVAMADRRSCPAHGYAMPGPGTVSGRCSYRRLGAGRQRGPHPRPESERDRGDAASRAGRRLRGPRASGRASRLPAVRGLASGDRTVVMVRTRRRA